MILITVILLIDLLSHHSTQGQKVKDESQTSSSNEEILRQKYGPVILANMLFRHGERTILETFPTDPNKDSDHWKRGFGQLTEDGQKRLYKTGQWARSAYPDLVGNKYSVNNIYIRSSDADRCLMSAECFLAGLYPTSNGSELSFQPIPIHTIPKCQDNMLYMLAPCPRYQQEFDNVQRSNAMIIRYKVWKETLDNLTRLTGKDMSEPPAASILYDTLQIEKEQFNMELPKWTKTYYPEPLKSISFLEFKSVTETDILKRLKAGPLLSDMQSHLVSKAEGTLNPNRTLWIYSGHDQTIVAVLDALDLLRPPITIPSYASLFIIELRKLKNKFFVTLKYKEGTNDTALVLKMDKCDGTACTLEQFLKITRNMTVWNWEEECSLSNQNSSNINLEGAALWLSAPILLLCSVITCFYCRPRRAIRAYKIRRSGLQLSAVNK